MHFSEAIQASFWKKYWHGKILHFEYGAGGSEENAGHSMEFPAVLPMRGAATGDLDVIIRLIFQSTLPVWGATAKLHKYFLKFYRI